MITRRQALKATLLSAGALALQSPFSSISAQSIPGKPGTFKLPELPYPYDALEPFIDAETMKIHHTRHHQSYIDNLNKAVGMKSGLSKFSLEEIFFELFTFPIEIRNQLRNHGGGHYNHTLFWQCMKKGGGKPAGELARAINQKFGSLDKFKEEFTKAALSVFGSGWAWLSMAKDGSEILIETTSNQDNPLMNHLSPRSGLPAELAKRAGLTLSLSEPLLGIDVWEHAYYLKYQNRRADYINAFYNVINWDFVSARFAERTADIAEQEEEAIRQQQEQLEELREP